MAKSIEQKAVDVLANTISDSRFRVHEFSRLMVEQQPIVHQTFFLTLAGYINYLATFDKYKWYPNMTVKESQIANLINETIYKNLQD